jgi:hypothetical protein
MDTNTFTSRRDWLLHETTVHPAQATQRATTGECPFCLKKVQMSDKTLARHMCRHMRELSLASLPPSESTENEDEIEIEGDKEHPEHDNVAGGLESDDDSYSEESNVD